MERYRIRNNGENAYVINKKTFCYHTGESPSCPVPDTPVPYIGSKYQEAMIDVSTPGYKAISASGGIVLNPMIQEFYNQVSSPIIIDVVYYNTDEVSSFQANGRVLELEPTSGPLLTDVNSGPAVDAFLSGFSSERDIAITAAWANVDESEIMVLASLGELPETIRWMADVYTRFIKVLALFKARKIRLALKKQLMSPVKMADAILNFWLEMRYAIRPLAFELEQIINVLEKGINPVRHTARGYHSSSSSDSTATQLYFHNGGSSALETRVVTRTSSYRAGVLYEIGLQNDYWVGILGFDKPLESVYELTKLSFVIDWFLNVGDLLASFTQTSNLTPLGSWIEETHTFKTKCAYTDHQELNVVSPWILTDFSVTNAGDQEETRRIVRRIISPDKPVFPHIKINLDVAKLVDLVAIARSIYRGIT